MMQGKYEDAEGALQSALEKNSSDPDTLINLSVVSQFTGKAPEVREGHQWRRAATHTHTHTHTFSLFLFLSFFLSFSLSLSLYIYIYVCVCVCVCVRARARVFCSFIPFSFFFSIYHPFVSFKETF